MREREPQLEWDFGCNFSELEQKAMMLLAEYYTVEEDIDFQERRAKGIGLPIEPQIINRYGVDEDSQQAIESLQIPLTDGQALVSDVVSHYVDVGKHQYATIHRIHADIQHITPLTRDDKELTDGFAKMLSERIEAQGERVELTNIEQIAIRREPFITQAKDELARLRLLQEAVRFALDNMERKYPSEYLLLWHEYVERLPTQEVAAIIGGSETPTSPQEYRTKRRNAFEHFLQWCDVRMIPTCTHKRHRMKTGPKPNMELVSVVRG